MVADWSSGDIIHFIFIYENGNGYHDTVPQQQTARSVQSFSVSRSDQI
jgi:hypothetical protein